MSDDDPAGSAPQPAPPSGPATPGRFGTDDRGANVFERFFPGPSPRDPRVAERLDALARAAEGRAASRDRQAKQRRQPTDAGRQQPPSVPAAVPPATTEDLEKLTDALHEQTDVIRALLDAEIAIRDDARATAQNSRTFAIAGIAIAFFTLLATVVTVVAAFVDR